MTDAKKITIVNTLLGFAETNAIVSVYLDLAKQKIMSRLYPLGIPSVDGVPVDIPEEYSYIQCQLASRLYLRRGGEGEITHNENGVSRTYGTVNDEDILSQIIPYVEVMQ